jgi:hypothetical protein
VWFDFLNASPIIISRCGSERRCAEHRKVERDHDERDSRDLAAELGHSLAESENIGWQRILFWIGLAIVLETTTKRKIRTIREKY